MEFIGIVAVAFAIVWSYIKVEKQDAAARRYLATRDEEGNLK